jgi:hypothetical protein
VTRRLAAAVAVVVALLGVAGLALRAAPPQQWRVPIAVGEDLGGAKVVGVRRDAAWVLVDVARGGARASFRIEHREAAPRPVGTAPALVAGRYRLEAAGPNPADAAAQTAARERLRTWEAQWPRPPAFVTPAGNVGAPHQHAQRALLDVAAVAAVAGAIAALPDVLALCGMLPVLGAAVGLAFAAAMAWAFQPFGAWHANLHGVQRTFDVLHGVPPWTANLGRLHGYAWYTWMTPLVGGGPEGGRDPYLAAFALTLTALPMAAAWATLLTGSRRVGAFTALLLATAPTVLRVGASEAMYVAVIGPWCAAALALELWLRDGRTRWVALASLWLFLTMHARADLLLLGPAWFLLRLASAPERLKAPRTRWVLGAAATLLALASVPRALELLATEIPGDAGQPLAQPWRDPRSFGLLLLGAWAALRLPAVARVLPALDAPRLRAAGALVGSASGIAFALAWLHRPLGFEPGFAVHLDLDPRYATPARLAFVAAGGIALARQGRPAVAALVGWLCVAGAVHLGRYDGLSTYGATGLTTAAAIAALGGAGLAAIPGRWTAGIAAAGVLASAWGVTGPFLAWRHPKQQTVDLLRAAQALPEDVTLVALQDADFGPQGPFKVDRLPLARLLDDRHAVATAGAWLRGEVQGEAWFLETLDCWRPALSRATPHQARIDDEVLVGWSRTGRPLTDVRGRITLTPPQDVHWSACASLSAMADPPTYAEPLEDVAIGAIDESVLHPNARTSLARLPARPPTAP